MATANSTARNLKLHGCAPNEGNDAERRDDDRPTSARARASSPPRFTAVRNVARALRPGNVHNKLVDDVFGQSNRVGRASVDAWPSRPSRWCCALGGAADARRRASLRACEGGDAVSPEIAKLYEDKPVIELVTMGVGSLMWERHGHIALCIRYKTARRTLVTTTASATSTIRSGWRAGFFRGAEQLLGRQDEPARDAVRSTSVRRSHGLGAAAAAHRRAEEAGHRQARVRHPAKRTSTTRTTTSGTTARRACATSSTTPPAARCERCTRPTDGNDVSRPRARGLPRHAASRCSSRTSRWAASPIACRRTGSACSCPTTCARRPRRSGASSRSRSTSARDRPSLKELEKELADKNLPRPRDGPSCRPGMTRSEASPERPGVVRAAHPAADRAGLGDAALGQVPAHRPRDRARAAVLLGLVLWLLAIISPLPYVRWNESCLLFFPLDLAVLFLSPDASGSMRASAS